MSLRFSRILIRGSSCLVLTAAFLYFMVGLVLAQDDANWTPYQAAEPLLDSDFEVTSFYLPMRDGIRLAVDLYLPRVRGANDKFPTVLRTTCYGRRYERRAASGETTTTYYEPAKRLLANGYACVAVDDRGTGASFGTCPLLYAEQVLRDKTTILNWITGQPWSDGHVVSEGVSYEGGTAEMVVQTFHPSVRATAPQFTAYDIWCDVGFPGGICLTPLVKRWCEEREALDANRIEEAHKILNSDNPMQLSGIPPVDTDRDRSLFHLATEDHRYNVSIFEAAGRSMFIDDLLEPDPRYTVKMLSAHAYVEEFRRAAVPTCGISGWFDGGYQRSAIRRFMEVTTPGNRLIIGPWSHGGGLRYDPTTQTMVPSCFDREQELLRFFDQYTKSNLTGVTEEQPVHYYTMVEEKWKHADTWPPRGLETRVYYFGARNTLQTAHPSHTQNAAFDDYQVSYETGTGTHTRWDTVFGLGQKTFPDRRAEDANLLTYDTEPLASDMEVTGHPVVTLYVSSEASDGQFFVYLEDVNPDGTVIELTEGCLRGIHRKLAKDESPYAAIVPPRTYERKDAMPLVPGEIAELKFDLLPTSYLFRKGHRIRIALAGADKDHFSQPFGKPPRLRYFRSDEHASSVALPVMPN